MNNTPRAWNVSLLNPWKGNHIRSLVMQHWAVRVQPGWSNRCKMSGHWTVKSRRVFHRLWLETARGKGLTIVYDLTMHVESMVSSGADLRFALAALLSAPTLLLLFLTSISTERQWAAAVEVVQKRDAWVKWQHTGRQTGEFFIPRGK